METAQPGATWTAPATSSFIKGHMVVIVGAPAPPEQMVLTATGGAGRVAELSASPTPTVEEPSNIGRTTKAAVCDVAVATGLTLAYKLMIDAAAKGTVTENKISRITRFLPEPAGLDR